MLRNYGIIWVSLLIFKSLKSRPWCLFIVVLKRYICNLHIFVFYCDPLVCSGIFVSSEQSGQLVLYQDYGNGFDVYKLHPDSF